MTLLTKAFYSAYLFRGERNCARLAVVLFHIAASFRDLSSGLFCICFKLRRHYKVFQFWVSFLRIWHSTLFGITNCVSDIDNWKVNNKLKLDRDKTEFLLISSRYRPRPPLESLKVDNTCTTVVQTNSTRNLWPSSDAELFMSRT